MVAGCSEWTLAGMAARVRSSMNPLARPSSLQPIGEDTVLDENEKDSGRATPSLPARTKSKACKLQWDCWRKSRFGKRKRKRKR
jgi:hypothetical protein